MQGKTTLNFKFIFIRCVFRFQCSSALKLRKVNLFTNVTDKYSN